MRLDAGVLWLPAEGVTVNGSIINTTDSSTTTGFDDGQTVSVEADFQYRLAELPGGMNVGGFYSFNQDFAEIGRLVLQPDQQLRFQNDDDSWAIYWSGWQYLFMESASDKPVDLANGVPDYQGVGLFTRLGLADQNTNPVEWPGSIGVGGRGIIPTRDDDVFGVGYYYTHFQDTDIGGALGFDNCGQASRPSTTLRSRRLHG